MKTLEQAFSERRNIIAAVERQAKQILSDYCGRRGFLLSGRSKNIESLRDKIETGRFAAFDKIDDIVAFSVVIDTLSQETDVRQFIAKAFDVRETKSGTTLRDERVFDFDCTRMYVTLQKKEGIESSLNALTIEIQIRTIMQHAWSKITHPYVYKAATFDPKQARLAAELMAQIESIDRSLARFKTSSRFIKTINRREMTSVKQITNLVDRLVSEGIVPLEMRPANGRRLGENIYQSIKRDMRNNMKKPLETIETFFRSQAGMFPRSLSLYQLAMVALHQQEMLETGADGKARRYYVTDDLVSLFPAAKNIANRVVID